MQIDATQQAHWKRPWGSWNSFSYVIGSLARYTIDLLRYGKGTYLCNGNALVGRLLESGVESGVTFWRNAPAMEAITEKGRVVGLVIEKNGAKLRVHARKGVVLASGGFARSAELARQYLPVQDWTVTPRGNQGDGLRIGTATGGVLPDTAADDRALYTPVSEFRPRNGPVRTYPHLAGVTKPGAIYVDGDGQRFVNESAPYQDLGRSMVAAGVKKAYLIADKQYFRNHGLGLALPAPYLNSRDLHRRYLISAPTIAALAGKLKLDQRALSETVNRLNDFARDGKDLDFGRGEGSYDRMNGDPDTKPNPCLGPLLNGPFFAIPMHLGTAGTMYGLKTDQDARVVNVDGGTVAGLYAVGNDSNHFLGGKYPSRGMTLGPAIVFGYRAGLHLAAS